MSSPWLLAWLRVAGTMTHLLYFKRNEHHFNGLRYFQIALAVFLTAVAGLTRIGEKNTGEACALAAKYVGAYLVGVYASMLAYRIFYHPLNKFPGPFGARISSFWYSTHIKNANAHKLLLELHHKYGDFVRIGSSDLSIAHPDGPNVL